MQLIYAIIWTFVFIIDFINMLIGNEPSWFLVFCPLAILVVEYWDQYLRDR